MTDHFPDDNYLEFIRVLRQEFAIPILWLIKQPDHGAEIGRLLKGSDKYVVSPFLLSDLILIVNDMVNTSSISKNSKPEQVNQVIRSVDLELNLNDRQLLIRGEKINIRPKEFDLLYFLITNTGQVLSHDEILGQVWGGNYINKRTVDKHVKRLRERIEKDPKHPKHILTVYGSGYQYLE
jgi:DNA-binding response OmpR family regulator